MCLFTGQQNISKGLALILDLVREYFQQSCSVGSLSVPFGFLLDFLPLPAFPLSRLFVTHSLAAFHIICTLYPVMAPHIEGCNQLIWQVRSELFLT
jgi:hypothetical protein